MLLIFSFSPREAFRSPVYVLAIYMGQTEAQREEECVCNIVYYISWFSCKNKITFSVGRYILELNKSHKPVLLLSQ